MISFQHPEYWWAALALLIPLIIHLLNKGLKNEIDFGSLAWLKQEEKSLHQKFQFKNILQWLLRTLVFAVLLFMLLNPFWKENISIENTSLIVLDKSLVNETIKAITDTINTKNSKLVWNDFDLSEVNSNEYNNQIEIDAKKIISLLKSENKQPKSLTLIGQTEFLAFDKDSIQSNYPIHFQLMKRETEIANQAYVKQNGKVQQIRIAKQDKGLQLIERTEIEKTNSAKIIDFSSRSILIVYDDSTTVLRKQVEAAFKSLAKFLNIELLVETESSNTINIFVSSNESSKFDVAFWLDSKVKMPDLKNLIKQTFIQNDGLNFKETIRLNESESLINLNGFDKNEDLPFYLANTILKNSEIDEILNDENKTNQLPIVITELNEKDLAKVDNTITHSMLFPLSILMLLLLFAERLLNYKMAND